MFFFTLSYFLDNNFWNKKKNMIVLVHENHDKWPNVTPVQHVCSGVDQAKLVSSFCGSKCLPKIGFNNVHIFKYEHLKHFVWKDDNIFRLHV